MRMKVILYTLFILAVLARTCPAKKGKRGKLTKEVITKSAEQSRKSNEAVHSNARKIVEKVRNGKDLTPEDQMILDDAESTLKASLDKWKTKLSEMAGEAYSYMKGKSMEGKQSVRETGSYLVKKGLKYIKSVVDKYAEENEEKSTN